MRIKALYSRRAIVSVQVGDVPRIGDVLRRLAVPVDGQPGVIRPVWQQQIFNGEFHNVVDAVQAAKWEAAYGEALRHFEGKMLD